MSLHATGFEGIFRLILVLWIRSFFFPLVGRFTSRDEDTSQQLTYSLSNDDSGRFRVDSQGRLYKAKDTDYETQTMHTIRAAVKDNGNPAMKVI